MARIKHNKNSPFGSPFNQVVMTLVQVVPQMRRIKKIADDLTLNGTVPANLELSVEFGVDSGQGAAFYAAVLDINGALNNIVSLPQLDPGN